MPLPNDLRQHPSPAQIMELASQYSDLLYALFHHPSYKYAQPPTAEFVKPSLDTHVGLYWTADFVQNTFIEQILPFLPVGSTRRCKAIGNAWARADPEYNWNFTWDAAEGKLKDDRGEEVKFPTLPASEVQEKMGDVVGRGMMAKKIILENATDIQAQLLLGGAAFDFGEDVKKAAEAIQ